MVKFSWRKVSLVAGRGSEKVEPVTDQDVSTNEIESVDAPLDSVADVALLPVPVVKDEDEVDKDEEKVDANPNEVSAKDDVIGREIEVEKRDPMDVFSKAFGGSKATLDGNIADLGDGTKNISMKTKIHDVQALSVWEFVGKSAGREVLSDGSTLADTVGKMYAELAELIKQNSCSEEGWRADQLERIYTARREVEDLMPPINKMDGLLGRSKR